MVVVLFFAEGCSGEEPSLKFKKAGGGLRGRAQRLPPNRFSGGLLLLIVGLILKRIHRANNEVPKIHTP